MCGQPLDSLQMVLQLTSDEGELEVRAACHLGEARLVSPLPPAGLLADLSSTAPHPRPVLESVGRAMHQILLSGEVGRLAEEMLSLGRVRHQPLHLELRFDPDQVDLARYPWELVAEDYGNFLVQQGLLDLTRYITYPQPPPVFEAGLFGRSILQVVPQPRDMLPLQVSKPPLEKVIVLSHASFDELVSYLLLGRHSVWGLQFDGHGGLVQVCPVCGGTSVVSFRECPFCHTVITGGEDWQGALVFERQGLTDLIPVREIGAALFNAGVQVALLFACESGQVVGGQVFNGVAPGLLLAGVPVVVGMQYAIPDAFASRFAETFYRALLDTPDVLAAVGLARRMDRLGAWYSPVVYQRRQPALHEAVSSTSVYRTRQVDTAIPGKVEAGEPFLARLWIRRPETPPSSETELRQALNVSPGISIAQASAPANIKFEPLPGGEERVLRRGAAEVRLAGPGCHVVPGAIPLFVDESLDAPPAIFTVQARKIGSLSLTFSVWQEGAQIAALTHRVEAVERLPEAAPVVERGSLVVPVESRSKVEPNIVWKAPGVPSSTSSAMSVERMPQPNARLVVFLPGQKERVIPLNARSYLIGRGPSCDIVLPSEQASNEHASLEFTNKGFRLTDLNSRNGTTLNGRRIYPGASEALIAGDEIEIGGIRMRFYEQGVDAGVPGGTYAAPERARSGCLSVLNRLLHIGVWVVFLFAALRLTHQVIFSIPLCKPFQPPGRPPE